MRRTTTGILAALLAGATLTFLATGPASAGGSFCSGNSSNAPDGRIRLAGGEWGGGGGSYGPIGIDVPLAIGETANYQMQWRNMGGDNLTIRLKLGHLEKPGYAVRIFLGAENVWPLLKDGKALRFPHVPPGQRTAKIDVQIRNKTSTEEQAEVFVRGSYAGTPNPVFCDEVFAEANN